MQTTPGRAKRTIKPPRRLYEEDDDAVVVARRTKNNSAASQHGQNFVEAVSPPPATALEAVEVEHQPLALRAAQENHIPRARPSQRRSGGAAAHELPFEDDILDAGAVDGGDDSDASEMSKEIKGDHDVRIEDFDRPLMTESVEAAARKAGVPTRRVSNAGAEHPGALGTDKRTSLLSEIMAGHNEDAKGPHRHASSRPSVTSATPVKKQVPRAELHGGGVKPPGASPARPSTVKPAGTQSPSVVRKNACKKYEEVLVAAAKRLSTTGLPQGAVVAEPVAMAQAVELACHEAFGKASSITPAYREKFRLLFFSLKKNQDLCKRLMLGDLQPEQLVHMTKEQMDDPRNTKMRQEALEKSRKRVVLDDEAAAKFSTAANLAMANKELQEKETAAEKRQAEKREADKLLEEARVASERAKQTAQQALIKQHSLLARRDSGTPGIFGADLQLAGSDADMEDDAEPVDPAADDMSLSVSDGGVAGYDGGGEEVATRDQRQPGIPDDMRETDASGRPPRRSADGAAATRDGSPSPEYKPDPVKSRWVPEGVMDRQKTPPLADGRRAGCFETQGPVADAAETTAAAFAHVEDLSPLVLPSPLNLPAGGAPGVRLWTGYVEFPGEGTFRGEVQSLQGCGDLATIVKGTIAVVGKLPSANLEDFFEQLTPSRSRTVTLGLLRLNHASMDELTRLRCQEMYDEFKSSERCAVYKPKNEECYLIPSSVFGTRLCATAHVAARTIHKPAIPTTLQDFEFVLAHVHQKGDGGQQLAMELSARLKKDVAWHKKRDRMKKGKEAMKQGRIQRREKAIRAQKNEDDHIKQFHEAASMVNAAAASAAIKAATTAGQSANIPQPSDPRQRRAKPAGAAAAPTGQFTPSHPTPPPNPWADAPPPASAERSPGAAPLVGPSPDAFGALANFAPTAAEEPAAPAGNMDFDLGNTLASLTDALGLSGDATQATTDAPTTLPAPTAADEPAANSGVEMPALDDLMGILGAVEGSGPTAAPGAPANFPTPTPTHSAPLLASPAPGGAPMGFPPAASQPMHAPQAMPADFGHTPSMSMPASAPMQLPPPGHHMPVSQPMMHGQPGGMPGGYDPSRTPDSAGHPQSSQPMHGHPTMMMPLQGQQIYGSQPMMLAPQSSSAMQASPQAQLPLQGHMHMGHVVQAPGGKQNPAAVIQPNQPQFAPTMHVIPQAMTVSGQPQNMHVIPAMQLHAPQQLQGHINVHAHAGFSAPQPTHDAWNASGKRKHPPPPDSGWHGGDSQTAQHQRRRMGEGRGGGHDSRGGDDHGGRGGASWGGRERQGGRERPGTHAPPPDLVGVSGGPPPPPPPPRF